MKQEFERYLAEHLGSEAVQWLQLYLQGWSQKAIASCLNLQVKEVYRLREKISYHAVHVFALKHEPKLVGNWLVDFGVNTPTLAQAAKALPL